MMKRFTESLFVVVVLAYTSQATPTEVDIFGRSLHGSCKVPAGSGTCEKTSDCLGATWNNYCPNDADNVKCCWTHQCTVEGHKGYCRSKSRNGPNGGAFFPGHCPGDDDIQCAAKVSCKSNTGLCRSVSEQGCSGGTFYSGFCPGSSDVKCCVEGSKPPPPPSSSPPPSNDHSVGQRILEQAKTQKGVDYVWGGGSCSGPTKGGLDCSGLLCYSICQVTGRNIFKEGNLRVTHEMYCASEKRRGYKKYDFSERQAGDAVFFGPHNCNCDKYPKAVHHVGIMMDSGYNMWNALKTGTTVGKNNFHGWSGSDAHCPYVVRITE